MRACKELKFIDLSFNSFDNLEIKNLLNECPKIEEIMMINCYTSDNPDQDYFDLKDIIGSKIDEINPNIASLKRLELRLVDKLHFIDLRSKFKNRFNKNKINFKHNNNIVEILID